MFEEWLNELEDNKVGFAPFNHDGDIGKDGLAKVKAITPNYLESILLEKKDMICLMRI